MLNFTKKITFVFFVLCFDPTAFAFEGGTEVKTDTLYYLKNTNDVFVTVDVAPEFPGGVVALHRFFHDNLRFPAIARSPQIQGTVFVTFVVERDGSLTNPRVLRGIDPRGADIEAVRLIEIMPSWTPGKMQGVAVRTQFIVPIRFVLAGF